jgi:diadenosine tetraphosphate (Ap4A) HIT family hydrolase
LPDSTTLSDRIVYNWPGGIVSIATGSKRIPANAKFSRAWQAHIPIDVSKCPFELYPQEELENYYQGEPNRDGWRLTRSTTKSEPYHLLVMPETCAVWPEERTRSLGGEEKIAEAIAIAERRLENDGLACAQFSVQIGPLAAQNVPHLHYHLYSLNGLDEEPDLVQGIVEEHFPHLRDLLIFEDDAFRVIAGGHYAGQCFLLPHGTVPPPRFNAEVAKTLNRLVTLYATKFKSVEGMPPDFGFELSIRNGHVAFGMFRPVLNQIGTLETMTLLTPQLRGFNLAWSHEETARYLRE